MYSSGASTLLHNHHHYPCPELFHLPKLKPHTHQSQPLILPPLSPGDLCSVPRSVSIDLTTLRTSFVLVEPYSIYPCVSGLLHVARCPPDSPMLYVRTSFLLGTAWYFIYTHTHIHTHHIWRTYIHTPHICCVCVCVYTYTTPGVPIPPLVGILCTFK